MLAEAWLAAGSPLLAGEHMKVLRARHPKAQRTVELEIRLALAGADAGAIETVLAGAKADKAFAPAKLSRLYYQAGTILRARGQAQDALRMFAHAEAQCPAAGEVLRALAALHLAAGRREQARGYYARLVELLPDADDIDELRNTHRVLSEKKGGAK